MSLRKKLWGSFAPKHPTQQGSASFADLPRMNENQCIFVLKAQSQLSVLMEKKTSLSL